MKNELINYCICGHQSEDHDVCDGGKCDVEDCECPYFEAVETVE